MQCCGIAILFTYTNLHKQKSYVKWLSKLQMCLNIVQKTTYFYLFPFPSYYHQICKDHFGTTCICTSWMQYQWELTVNHNARNCRLIYYLSPHNVNVFQKFLGSNFILTNQGWNEEPIYMLNNWNILLTYCTWFVCLKL